MILPPRLLEFTNAILWPALAIAAVGSAVYLGRALGDRGSFRSVYEEDKGVIALFVMFFGFAIRTSGVWWLRYLENHYGIAWSEDGTATLIHLCSSVAVVVGAMCWLRVTLFRCGWRAWAAMIAICIGFGLLTTLG